MVHKPRIKFSGMWTTRMCRVFLWIRRNLMITILFLITIFLLTVQMRVHLIATKENRMGAFIGNFRRESSSRSPSRINSSAIDTLFRILGYQTTKLPQCPFPPTNLVGLISVSYQSLSWHELESKHASVQPGGLWKPANCTAQHRVAVIVPYRDRTEHLRVFLDHIHPFLQKQLIQYGIYIVEQDPYTPFNRGLLLNIGYKEAMADATYDCVIFHDVDLLPENDFNLYSCPEQPRHMSVAVDEFGYRLPYDTIFGGVEAFRKDQFELVNGFSNLYFGWGAEDDDLFERLQHHGINITRYNQTIARYSMVRHLKNEPNPERLQILKESKDRFRTDGLNSLIYDRKRLEHRKLFTWIYVKINRTAVMESAESVSPVGPSSSLSQTFTIISNIHP